METHGRASSRGGQERRRVAVLAWSCAIAMVLALATLVAVAARKHEQTTSKDNVAVVSRIATSAAAAPPSSMNVTAICLSTPYPSACETALSSAAARSAKDPFVASVQFAMTRAASARELARNLSASSTRRRAPPSGMDDCAELLDISLDQLSDALAGSADAAGVTTWLSAALTNQGTCGDSLAAVAASAGHEAVRARVGALVQFIGTALALHAKLKGGDGNLPSAGPTPSSPSYTFPSWVSKHDRHLLESPAGSVTPDAVVALDGSGTHRSCQPPLLISLISSSCSK